MKQVFTAAVAALGLSLAGMAMAQDGGETASPATAPAATAIAM